MGSLFYPNLIRLLYEAEDVPRFDHEEEDFVLDPEVIMSFDEEAKEGIEKKKEEKKNEKKEVGEKMSAEEVLQISERVLMLQQHILKQKAVWVFVKASHEWYSQWFGETILSPLVSPDWVLPDVDPSGYAHEKRVVPAAPAEPKKKSTLVAAKATIAPLEKTIQLDSDENDIALPNDQ